MTKKQNQKIDVGAVLRVFWQHARRYQGRLGLLMLLYLAANVTSVFVPLYYKRFFDVLAGEVGDTSRSNVELLTWTLMMIAGLHLLMWLGWRLGNLISNWFQPRIKADLEQTALQHVHEHSYRFFSNNFAGSLVRKVHRLSRAFEDFADQLQFHFIPLTVILVGNLLVLYTRSQLLAAILLGWIVVFMLVNGLFARWKLKYDFRRAAIDSESTGVLADSLTNAITVKSFTGRLFEFGLFKEVTERLRRANMFTWNLNEVMEAIQALLMVAIEFVIMYVAVRLWRDGVLTVGDFALIQSYLLGIFNKVWDFGRAIRNIFSAFADGQEMVEILNMPQEVVDVDRAKTLAVESGRIEFQKVYFSFNQTRRVLRDFTLTIEPREKIALVGPSGAGKSTVTKLLFRFYDVERGKILIDGQNIGKVTQESLRAQIALVPQEPILFHRSIMENIRYGQRDAADGEVLAASKKARAHEFITQLPQGYDTFVGERGVKLSGGERQRVAIARAILKDAPILVLDEATSSLDSESEALIQEALAELMRDKTTIVIAHRLSTIMKMDRIVVIAKGRVVDSGTHEALLHKRDGIYKKLWEIQAGGFIR